MDFALPSPKLQQDGSVTFGSDERLFVQFYTRAVLHGAESEAAGRPVHKPIPYVKIMQPGERDVTERPAHDGDRARFPKQWQAYKDGLEQQPDGTPLDTLFPAQPEIVADYRAMRVFTVEQLATLSDTQLQNLGMGARDRQTKARNFLEAAGKMKAGHALQTELGKRDDEIAKLKAQLNALASRLADDDQDGHDNEIEITAALGSGVPAVRIGPNPPKRRGRPPKTQPEGN